MKIRCLIADDEPIARQIVANYIEQIPHLALVGSCKDAFEVMDELRKKEVDLLFLDINMPKLSGISLLRSLTKRPQVILTTAYKEYALEGFELSVTDYLLKPFSLERFLQAIQKVEQAQSAQAKPQPQNAPAGASSPTHLFVKVDRQMVKVVLEDIRYVSAYGNYIKIHLPNETLLSLQTLGQFLEKLPAKDFVQIHKSHLINFRHLKALEGNRVKVDEEWLAVGKAHRTRLLERMNP
ncbi:MAG: response regulator transcription factor [Bacteroidota bacterium]